MDQEETLRAHYVQLNNAQEHFTRVQNHLNEVEERIGNVRGMQATINAFMSGERKEILVPLAHGIFTQAQQTTPETVLVNVGADIIIKKTPQQAKDLLIEQENQLHSYREQILEKYQEAHAELEQLVKRAEELTN